MRSRDGGERSFDAVLVAPGARAVIGVEGAAERREFRSADPAIAALGRQMRQARER